MCLMMFVLTFWKKKRRPKIKTKANKQNSQKKQTNKPKVGLPVSKNHLTKFRLTFNTFKVASFLRASFTDNGLYMVAT